MIKKIKDKVELFFRKPSSITPEELGDMIFCYFTDNFLSFTNLIINEEEILSQSLDFEKLSKPAKNAVFYELLWGFISLYENTLFRYYYKNHYRDRIMEGFVKNFYIGGVLLNESLFEKYSQRYLFYSKKLNRNNFEDFAKMLKNNIDLIRLRDGNLSKEQKDYNTETFFDVRCEEMKKDMMSSDKVVFLFPELISIVSFVSAVTDRTFSFLDSIKKFKITVVDEFQRNKEDWYSKELPSLVQEKLEFWKTIFVN